MFSPTSQAGNFELNESYSESEKKFLLQYIEKEKSSLPYQEIIFRLNLGEPIDYILGYTYFYGLKLEVDSNVLIPRPETEELVEWIIQENKDKEGLHILDIGAGSGCITIALKKNLKNSSITAVDVSCEALEIVKKNALFNEVLLKTLEVNILNDSEWSKLGMYDLIVSNPPYISSHEGKEMSPSVLNFEPHLALFVEDDPLIFYKRILEFGNVHLNEGGSIYFETSQSHQLEAFEGFELERMKDLSGNWRFLKAVKTIT